MKLDASKVNLLEKDIEDWLWENPQDFNPGKHGGKVRWLARQYKVPSGIIDLLGISHLGSAWVVEVKNGPIDSSAIAQVSRYTHEIQQALDHLTIEHDVMDMRIHAQAVCIGTGITNNHVMFEAEAMNVWIKSFGVTLTLEIYDRSWSSEFAHKLDIDRATLKSSPEIQEMFATRLETWAKHLEERTGITQGT